jgi:NTE family protein
MQWGVHRMGVLQGAPLLEAARELFERYRPQIPYALTMVEVPSLRTHIVRDGHVTWRHLAASCAIPFGFPPVEIEGRRYVDGGFRGALPLWAAEALGAQSALALNVLNTPLFRALHATMWMQRPSGAMKVTLLEPSSRLGSLRDAVVWDAEKIRRWIELGQLDAQRLAGAAMGAIYQPDRA